jgi:membrane protease subunit HflK
MRVFRIVLLMVVVLYLLTGVVQVRRGERAVIRRFGRVLPHQPDAGLHVGLPWGLDRVDRIDVDNVRTVTVGYREEESPERDTPPGQLLTGDHNLVNVQVVLYYKVRPEEVAEYVIAREGVPGVLERAVEATAAEWVGGRGVDEVLLHGKNLMRGAMIAQIRERIPPYRLGVEVLDARVARIAPPDEVKDAFDNVARAQTGIATARYRAEQDAATRLRLARAERFRIEQSAAAYAHDRKVIALQDAKRFRARLKQYQAAREKNPKYLLGIWQAERGKLFATMKEQGQIDLLDRRLGQGGLDVLTAPRLPANR